MLLFSLQDVRKIVKMKISSVCKLLELTGESILGNNGTFPERKTSFSFFKKRLPHFQEVNSQIR